MDADVGYGDAALDVCGVPVGAIVGAMSQQLTGCSGRHHGYAQLVWADARGKGSARTLLRVSPFW
jgi:hypothetical protein